MKNRETEKPFEKTGNIEKHFFLDIDRAREGQKRLCER